jgi:hypothetical protein
MSLGLMGFPFHVEKIELAETRVTPNVTRREPKGPRRVGELEAGDGLAERLPIEARVAVDDVARSVVRDALEDILPGAATAREGNEGVAEAVKGEGRDADSFAVGDELIQR